MIEIWMKEQYSFEGLLKLFISIHKNSKGLIMSYISPNRTKGTVKEIKRAAARAMKKSVSPENKSCGTIVRSYKLK